MNLLGSGRPCVDEEDKALNGGDEALICRRRDAADSSSGVLLWLERVDDALGRVLEVAVAGPGADKAIGPRLSAGGMRDVRTGSKCVEEGGEGRYERGVGGVRWGGGGGRRDGSMTEMGSQEEMEGRRASLWGWVRGVRCGWTVLSG